MGFLGESREFALNFTVISGRLLLPEISENVKKLLTFPCFSTIRISGENQAEGLSYGD